MGSHTANIESLEQLTKKSIPEFPIIQDPFPAWAAAMPER